MSEETARYLQGLAKKIIIGQKRRTFIPNEVKAAQELGTGDSEAGIQPDYSCIVPDGRPGLFTRLSPSDGAVYEEISRQVATRQLAIAERAKKMAELAGAPVRLQTKQIDGKTVPVMMVDNPLQMGVLGQIGFNVVLSEPAPSSQPEGSSEPKQEHYAIPTENYLPEKGYGTGIATRFETGLQPTLNLRNAVERQIINNPDFQLAKNGMLRTQKSDTILPSGRTVKGI